MQEYSKKIDNLSFIHTIEEISSIIDAYEKEAYILRPYLEPATIETVHFDCNCCGKCCKSFTIGVSLPDIKRMIDQGMEYLLPFISPSTSRSVFQFMNRQMFKANELIFSLDLISKITLLNPSLSRNGSKSLAACMFFNLITNRCTIYDVRPLECRVYPIGNLLNDLKNVLCPEDCFNTKNTINLTAFMNNYDKNRLNDVTFSALYHLNPLGGWRKESFKLSMLLHHLGTIF